ncbi:four helix bundle protein [Rhodohalobacter mucosus]|uniref:Four helix bundle protein n=1 Tax=Rhodohalobacter mucosus TaxID=2079485 RepID=A0A316TX59_9BACT|nr:four helix bundle protein [Rhodohalobacter mucosus]PWN07825.1 four helix bundle protein [Rhodohalobacter mucosus]
MDKRFYTYSFEKLEVWQEARTLKKLLYKITQDFPREEIFGLTSQIRRSAASITANLAEGAGRASDKDKAYFTNIAYSSALEIIDHTVTSFDLEYITEAVYVEIRQKLDVIINKLNSLYKHHYKRGKNLKDLDL